MLDTMPESTKAAFQGRRSLCLRVHYDSAYQTSRSGEESYPKGRLFMSLSSPACAYHKKKSLMRSFA